MKRKRKKENMEEEAENSVVTRGCRKQMANSGCIPKVEGLFLLLID